MAETISWLDKAVTWLGTAVLGALAWLGNRFIGRFDGLEKRIDVLESRADKEDGRHHRPPSHKDD